MENLIKSSSKMKWSRYNYMKQLTNRKVIVFNCSTKNYIYITENQSNLIKENKGRIQEIKSLDNNLYQLLI